MLKYPTVDIIILTNKRVIEETKITKAEKHGLLAGKRILDTIVNDMKMTKGDV